MVRNSSQSVQLANVQRQLRSGKTRGTNPRSLSPEEVQALEARRDQLQAEILEAQRKRVADRVNAHNSTEAEATRKEIRADGDKTRAAIPKTEDIAAKVLEALKTEVVPLPKNQKEWIQRLTPMTVAVLNGFLTANGLQTKRNKTNVDKEWGTFYGSTW